MISQQQNDIHLNEEETPPPHDQKHPSAPAYSWRSWNLWLRIIGVVLAFAGGLSILYTTMSIEGNLLIILVGVVSAGLIRSWRSFLIVPGAFSLGILIILFIFADRISIDEYFILVVIPTLLSNLVLAEIGVAIGTPIGKLIEKRLRH
jgi:hypothetical protein